MSNPSMDRINYKFNRHILLAQEYTELTSMSFIIKSCRLKPHNYIFGNLKLNSKIQLHKLWIDEYGNSFKIIKGKKIEILYNDLSLDRNKIISTDLYGGLSIDKIAKMSKLCYLFLSKMDEPQENFFVITFLGIDNYLRSYAYLDDIWKPVSSLILGIEVLNDIYWNKEIKYSKELKSKGISAPCQDGKGWITYLPISEVFYKMLCHQYDDIFCFLNTKE